MRVTNIETVNIIQQNNMAEGLTLEQMQAKGLRPIATPTTPTTPSSDGGFTPEQMLSMNAQPTKAQAFKDDWQSNYAQSGAPFSGTLKEAMISQNETPDDYATRRANSSGAWIPGQSSDDIWSTLGTTAANALPSLWGLVKGAGEMIAHPIETGKGLIQQPDAIIGDTIRQPLNSGVQALGALAKGDTSGAMGKVVEGFQKAKIAFEDDPFGEILRLKGLKGGIGKSGEEVKAPIEGEMPSAEGTPKLTNVETPKSTVWEQMGKITNYWTSKGLDGLATKWQELSNKQSDLIKEKTSVDQSIGDLTKDTNLHDRASVRAEAIQKTLEDNAQKLQETLGHTADMSIKDFSENTFKNDEGAVGMATDFLDQKEKIGSDLYNKSLKSPDGTPYPIQDLSPMIKSLGDYSKELYNMGEKGLGEKFKSFSDEYALRDYIKKSGGDHETFIKTLIKEKRPDLLDMYNKNPEYYSTPVTADSLSLLRQAIHSDIPQSTQPAAFAKFSEIVDPAVKETKVKALGEGSPSAKMLEEADQNYRDFVKSDFAKEMKKNVDDITGMVPPDKGMKIILNNMSFVEKNIPVLANMVKNKLSLQVLQDARLPDGTYDPAKLYSGLKKNAKYMQADHIMFIQEMADGLQKVQDSTKKAIGDFKEEAKVEATKAKELADITGTDRVSFEKAFEGIDSTKSLHDLTEATDKSAEEITKTYLSSKIDSIWKEKNMSEEEKITALLKETDSLGGKIGSGDRPAIRTEMLGDMDPILENMRTIRDALKEIGNAKEVSGGKRALNLAGGIALTMLHHFFIGTGLIAKAVEPSVKDGKLDTATSIIEEGKKTKATKNVVKKIPKVIEKGFIGQKTLQDKKDEENQ